MPALTSAVPSSPLLHAFCHRCERWRVLDTDAFAVDFAVTAGTPEVAQCPDCGEFGLVKVRLPSQPSREAALSLAEISPYEVWRRFD